jgi:hypothetical protein
VKQVFKNVMAATWQPVATCLQALFQRSSVIPAKTVIQRPGNLSSFSLRAFAGTTGAITRFVEAPALRVKDC